jgi:phosphoribosylformylglycinamidine synthase
MKDAMGSTPDSAITPAVYRGMGISDTEYELIVSKLGREPTYTELGMLAVMWSEHCGYKSSRNVLRLFKRYADALEGEGFENAGIVDIGDGLGIAMKMESHNHPSAVEPYNGAATGVGGILRDIFTMGARPIASLNSLRFGPIRDGDGPSEEVARNRYLFEHVVAGIGGYGNCVGVPTVAGEVLFHPRYSGNPLVNAMAVGVVRLDSIASARADGPGNPVLYVGSSTGKDGIHGATFASDTLGEDSEASRPNVQIGDPFAEKLLIEATLEALETGAIVGIQDMGAAGLTCSTCEMSAKGGVGMEIEIRKVPLRDRDMSPYEVMLSESQERMLAVVQRGREEEVRRVFHKWELAAEVIGQVTEGGRVRVTDDGQVVADIPAKMLTDECPVYDLEARMPEVARKATEFDPHSIAESPDYGEALLKLLASPNIASKRWVYEQYDYQVQTQTALLPGRGDAAVLALRDTQRGIALSVDGNGRYCFLDPYEGGRHAVAEAARNVACVGARPRAVTDCLNFGDPNDPAVYWQFKNAVRGIAEAAEQLGTPVISGNVSFYNESPTGEVLPTPTIGMLGVLEDASARIGMGFHGGSGLIFVLWRPAGAVRHSGIGASEYLAVCHGIEDGLPVHVDLDAERAVCEFLFCAAHERIVDSAHDSSDGGLAVALAECCITGDVGAYCMFGGDMTPQSAAALGDIASGSPDLRAMIGRAVVGAPLQHNPFTWSRSPAALLFGEVAPMVLLGIIADDRLEARREALHRLGKELRLEVRCMGAYDASLREIVVVGAAEPWVRVPVAEARAAYEGAIPSAMGEPAAIPA